MDNWSNGNAAQHLRLFDQPTDGSKISTQSNAISILNHVLASRPAMYLQALVVPLALWIKPIVIFLAIFWLSYRAYRVLCIPLDELAILLGFDIPPVPSVDIAGIKADGAIIHWSLPEKQKAKSSSKYELHLDGRIIETLSTHEDAVTISGLRPGSYHVVRVALVTSHDFSSKSAPARFRTRPDSSPELFHHVSEGHASDDDYPEPLLRITPYRGLKDFAPIPDEHPVQALRSRDSVPNLNRRRSTINRRASPAAIEVADKTSEEVDSESEIIRQLTEKLDEIRREHQEIERSAREEEEEDVRIRDALIKERDQLRAEVAEKERASRNLRKEVESMSRQNTASQQELSKHRRLLEQKQQERRKFYEDMKRWEVEAAQMRAETAQLYEQKEENDKRAKAELADIRQQLAEKMIAIKAAEEEIKETNAEIKRVERNAKNSSPSDNDNVISWPQQLQLDADEDRRHAARMLELQQEYSIAARQLEQSKQFYATSMQYLEAARERRRQEEAAIAAASASHNRDLTSPPSTQERLPSRRDSQRSRRDKESPLTTHFGPSSVFGGALNPTNFSSAPLFAYSNGIATNSDGMSEEDRERLTGGAHVSPAAVENLLPADLFGSDDRNTTEDVLPLPGLGALPGLPGSLPGLGQQPTTQDSYGAGPASPASVSSRAASTFASPQASQQNLNHHLSSPDALNDSDRRSIRSNRSARAASNEKAGSRFSAMFGIRPRNKNALLNDPLGLPLGKTHSHSMPRQDGGLAGLDNMARKRNSSLSGSAFDTALDGDDTPASNNASDQPKKRLLGLNPFSKEKTPDSWPSSFSPFGRRPTSPKPESSHSSELPRPSFDSTRLGFDPWPAGEPSNAARASPLSLGGWNAPIGQPRAFASRHQSRRTSLQHSISSPPDDIIEDDDSDILDPDLEPHLAPIGTKPTSSKKAGKQADTKLNPNAKDFKSFLGIRLREKEKGKLSTDNSTAPGKDSVEDDSSPAQSRRSRDGRSIATRDSSISGSRRNSNPDELVLSPSLTNSEATSNSPQIGTGTSFGKESFMQKITRKSSSSKFALPTFKRDKTKLDAQSPALPPTADDDEDAMSASVGSLKEKEKDSRESVEKNRGAGNARSWSNVLKIGKKRAGGETPSVSELSTASEMTGDDAEEV